MVSPKCVIVKRVNQAWELSTKMQISAAVKLIFHGGGKNVCGKKFQGTIEKELYVGYCVRLHVPSLRLF